MEYLVCYDIADDRRRDRFATALLDFGRRIQESVFVAALDEELLGRMKERVCKLIVEDEDSIFVIPVCEACRKKAESYGRAAMPVDKDFYIV